MNSRAPLSSRRHLLNRLFPAPDVALKKTELAVIPELHQKTNGVLWAIVGDAPDNVFIAGDDGMVFHFDGEHWKREDLGSKLNVHALCIRGEEVFSVGWLGLICVRREGQWFSLRGGQHEISTVNQPLFDCEVAIDGSLWAVGDHGRICQYNGRQWIEHISSTTANLRVVLPLADGRILAGGLGGTVLELCDGKWRKLKTNTGCSIVSMAPLGEDTVVAVGGEYCTRANQFRGRMFLYSKENWSVIELEHPLPRLRCIRREGNSLLITGDGGTAFRWSPDGVRQLSTGLRYDLHGIISFVKGQALICGDHGTVLKEKPRSESAESVCIRQKSRWKKISNGETNKTLRTLWVVDEDHFIAAGDSGTVLHITGEQITVTETPGKLRIHALWGSSIRNIFAVCDKASILHFNGEEWSVAHRGRVDTALLAITGFGPHELFAVGDNGYALRYDGLMWRSLETGVKHELYGLWGKDSQHLLAVGGGGTVLRWDGERWKSFGAGTEQDLFGVNGSSLNRLFIAGLAGTLIRFEDNSWHREYSGVRSDLHCVTNDGSTFYVVGSNGTILRNSDGIWEPEESDCQSTLQAVCVRGNSIFAAGSGGILLRRLI